MKRLAPAAVSILMSALPCLAASTPNAKVSAKLDPSLRLLLAARAMPERASRNAAEASSKGSCHVTIRFEREPEAATISALEAQGVAFDRLEGRLCRFGRIYGAKVPWAAIERLARRADVARVESVWKPRVLPALDLSGPEIQAPAAWTLPGANGLPLTGHGVRIADFDTGVDVYHPHFWRADGDTFLWLDVNGSGAFEPGADGVDLDRDGAFDPNEKLRFFDGQIYDPALTFGGNGTSNADNVFQSHWDWLYNDANSDGQRNRGPSAGFNEGSPTYGERLLVLLDGDGDLALDPGERLVALGTSKIAATLNTGGVERTRGVDLIQTQADNNGHGTAVSGILCGGVRGVSRFCGIAPDADILVGNFFSDISMTELLTWASSRSADVCLYEGAGFVFLPLDGSTNDELVLDDASQTMLQVTPAGNLCRGYKHAQLALAPSGSAGLTFFAPATYGGSTIRGMYKTLLWRTPTNDISFSLTTPGGVTGAVPGEGSYVSIGGYQVYSARSVSPRGTAEFDIEIYSPSGVGGAWTLTLTNGSSASEEVNAYLADDVTSWADGAEYTNYRSTDKTVCWPATADSAFTLASYSTRGYEGYNGAGGGSVPPGGLSAFSSRGKRIDGVSILEIASPGNYDVYSSRSQYAGGVFGGYRQFSGTSAAGPHVAAGAGLVLQAFPGLLPFEVKERLTFSAAHDAFTGPGYNDSWGHGKLRIHDAVAPYIVAVPAAPAPPAASFLEPGFPNPFRPATTVRYSLPASAARAPFTVRVFDARGRLVKTLAEGEWGPEAACGTARWDGRAAGGEAAAAGVYFVRLEAAGTASAVKVVRAR